MDVIAEGVRRRHAEAFPDRAMGPPELDWGGEYQWRREGEYHLFNPDTVFKLQHATKARRYSIFKEYTNLVDDQNHRHATLRGLFAFKRGHFAGAARRGRAGGVDPRALPHGSHVVRLHQSGRRTRRWPSP